MLHDTHVGIDEPRLPALGPLAVFWRFGIFIPLESVSVVLRGDVHAASANAGTHAGEGDDGLVVATVTKLHAIDFQTGSEANNL